MYVSYLNSSSPTAIYTLSLHDALPISERLQPRADPGARSDHSRQQRLATRGKDLSGLRDHPPGGSRRLCRARFKHLRSEEHTSELQSLRHLVCRLLLEKKNNLRTQSNV